MGRRHKFHVGDWVEVRSKEEILETLDPAGRLEGLPFMPEMFQFCGHKFQVFKSAHKTCDYTTVYPYRTRRINRTVHLQTRCDGGAHDGCQAGCLILWKEAWLKPGGRNQAPPSVSTPNSDQKTLPPSREATVWGNTRKSGPTGVEATYVCQATETPLATAPLAWWDLRQYFRDFWSGNVSLWRLFCGFVYSAYFHLSQAGIGLGPPMRWTYNKFHRLWRGPLFPRTPGRIPSGSPTPSAILHLQPGEWVRVKSHLEILETVDGENKNRGMYWDAELVPYCGGTYRVLRRVTRLIDEKTGKMLDMKSPCIVLDSVTCQARYSQNRMFCPKAMYPYWREIWLERLHLPAGQAGQVGISASDQTELPAEDIGLRR